MCLFCCRLFNKTIEFAPAVVAIFDQLYGNYNMFIDGRLHWNSLPCVGDFEKKKKKAATITDNENPSEALSFTDPLWSQHRDGKIWKKPVWFKPFQVPAAQLQMVYLMFYSSQKLRGLTFSNRGGKVELVWGWRTKSYAVCSIKRKHADAVLKTYMYNTEAIWMRGGPTVSLWDQQGDPESDPWKG